MKMGIRFVAEYYDIRTGEVMESALMKLNGLQP